MKSDLKSILLIAFLSLGMFLSFNATAQTTCCHNKNNDEITCCKEESDVNISGKTDTAKAPGCTPSACRGAKTKFGEAKVISDLRLDLIALKSEMENSKSPTFNSRSYDIHGIIGNSDDESIEIIAREVKIVEKEFAEKLDYQADAFILPENKAKQVSYLNKRIASLKKLL